MFFRCLIFTTAATVFSDAACSSIADCNGRQCLDCTCSDGNCVCADGYTGPNCETAFCVNRTDGCSGHGECNMQRTSITCACDSGWEGSHCSLQPCMLNCQHGSTPNVPNSTCTYCVNCAPGYNGTTCSDWVDPPAALAAAQTQITGLRNSVTTVIESLKNPAFCSNGHECVGWGVNFVTGEPKALPFNNFNFTPGHAYDDILCPNGALCTYHSGALEPVFEAPSGAKAYVDVLDYASHFSQLRAQNQFQRGPFVGANMTSMSPTQANAALFNKPPGDRAPTVAQATFFFIDMKLETNTSLQFNSFFTDHIFNMFPPSYAKGEEWWDYIFENFGTHVVVSGSMGGILEMQSFWNTELLQTDPYTISSLEAQSKLAFANWTGLSWPAGTASVDSNYTKNTNVVFSCFGGNDTLCPSNGGNAATTAQWIASVRDNPLLAQYKVDRLSKYMDDGQLASLWDSAVDAYIAKKQTDWEAENKCPTSCTNTESGATGTCSGTEQTSCVCPCHKGRTCAGQGICLDSVCCPSTQRSGGCDYGVSQNGSHAQPNGDGDWWVDPAISHFPTVVQARTNCDACCFGMHCDCEVPFPFPTVEYNHSDWHWAAGCGGGCDRSADVTVHQQKQTYAGATTCQYPQPCKPKDLQSRESFDRAINQALLDGNPAVAHALAEDGVERGLYHSVWQRPSKAYISGVNSTFFPVPTDETPYVAELETPGVLQIIQQEVVAFNRYFAATSSDKDENNFQNTIKGASTSPHFDAYEDAQSNALTELEPGSWGQILLMDRELNFTSDARKYFPNTVEILKKAVGRSTDQIAGMPPGGVVLARLPPHLRIRAHVGLTNARLRVSYGIFVPRSSESNMANGNGQPLVGIRVGNETRTWHEGKALILDDSYEHSAWNNGDTDRIVLLADFWHPGVSHSQRRALEEGQLFYHKQNAKNLFLGNVWEKIRCQSSAKMWEEV